MFILTVGNISFEVLRPLEPTKQTTQSKFAILTTVRRSGAVPLMQMSLKFHNLPTFLWTLFQMQNNQPLNFLTKNLTFQTFTSQRRPCCQIGWMLRCYQLKMFLQIFCSTNLSVFFYKVYKER